MAYFTSDGFEIHYEDTGPGPVNSLILVHGFSSNAHENWVRTGWVHAAKVKGLRCITLDLRGHGQSAKPHDPGAYGRDNLAGDVLALMDHLGLEKADLMGFSLGAYVALSAALAQPGRFWTLILGGIGGRMLQERPADDGLARAMEADDIDAIAEPLHKSFRQFADEQGEDRLALAACSRALRIPVDRQALEALGVATLVVAGARDDLAGDPQALADVIMGARAVRLPGCDHFSAIAHGLYKAAVFDFLDGVLDDA
jgi:pimeloyl-ACP methyl ester carboxylesterase